MAPAMPCKNMKKNCGSGASNKITKQNLRVFSFTLNLESSFTRRERNHSPLHWNTLTSPEPRKQSWMSNKRDASMIQGISMDQEIWLILGQISLNLLNWKKNLQTDICSPERGLTRKHLTSRSDFLGSELWTKLRRNVKLKERQKWTSEKSKLDNARRLRRNYFIDHQDMEFNENKQMQEENWKRQWLPSCKIMKKNCGSDASNKIKNKTWVYFGSWWIYKTTYGRNITESSWRPYCRKRKQFITAFLFGSQIYSYASSYKKSSSRSSSKQGMGKLKKISAWNLTKLRSKKDVIDEARTTDAKVHFASLMDICHLKKCWIGDKAPKI